MMFKAENKTRAALSVLAVMLGAPAAPVSSFAQDAAASADAPATAAGAPRLGWYKTCSKQEDNDVCVVQNVVLAGGGQLVTGVGLITVSGKINNKSLQFRCRRLV